MGMTPIEGAQQGPGALKNVLWQRAVTPAATPARRKASDGDSVQFSDAGRSAAESRDARVAEARAKLESGALYSPAAFQRAAAHLLRSGDLDRGGA